MKQLGVVCGLVVAALCNLHEPLWAAESDLDAAQAARAIDRLWQERAVQLRQERTAEMRDKVVTLQGKSLRWKERVFGEAPPGGHSLWISMHGGGNAPAEINDQQWRNQVELYKPEEGIYVAPRAPTDHWNLWHESHIDAMFDRLIEDYVVLRGVNPDRVYIMGYSAGGDGVWQLAPRMADRWAAAAMMAGHPNDASLLGLRNLPFALFSGAQDSAFGRNKIIAERGQKLDELEKADPGGYEHLTRIYPGLGHWMNRKDAEALPWMAKHSRNPWPKKVVWQQAGTLHTRFYWLAVPREEAKRGAKIVAEVDGQTVRISGAPPRQLTLRLSDSLLNLDQPITVLVEGKEVYKGRVPRRTEAISESLQQRADVRSAAVASLNLSL